MWCFRAVERMRSNAGEPAYWMLCGQVLGLLVPVNSKHITVRPFLAYQPNGLLGALTHKGWETSSWNRLPA
jgi:hypothetical protein